ncbi:MAG: EAL domain-containing protein [Desulfobacterales bacterium]|nr:EAL domain-containing protein [Desulfobacterales bacterium]
MTLFRQIMVFITALLFLVLVIVFSINFNESKTFVQNDLYLRAKNSVNSLSLSLGDVSDDVFLMETTINAMFDGGHFQRITLKDPDNKLLYEKEEDLVIQGVPNVFIRFIDLKAPVAEAVISNGWNIVGSLQVQGHTGEACIKMWEVFKDLSLSFSVLWVACVILSSLMLKLLLKSLDRIREQAEALGENKFIINPHIPTTVELKKVVIQMNKMVKTVQNNYTRSIETIKEARMLQFRDGVSGLFNKAYFVRQIQVFLTSEEAVSKGEVAIIDIEGLEELKDVEGYAVSEAFIKDTAELLNEQTRKLEDRVVTRLNETEFAFIFPGLSTDETMDIMNIIQESLQLRIESDEGLSDFLRVLVSVASYSYEDDVSGIFSKLDYSLTLARNSAESEPVHFREKKDTLLGRGEWKSLIEKAISGNKIIFSYQPVLSDQEALFHNEIFIAMKDDLDNVKSAGFFMPMAMELGLARKVDQHVMTRMVKYLESDKERKMTFGINISADFIQDRNSFIWARQFLSAHKHMTSHLTFEMSEAVLVRYPEISLDYAGLLKGMGFRFGIDNFTISDDSLAMLQQLTPDYIKVDYAYLYDTRDRTKSKITLSMLQNITESLNINLIGTKIETSTQREDLNAEGILYFQGRQVAEIQPLEKYDG